MRDSLFHLERSRPATLQAQICDVLMGAISTGQLKPGDLIPSTRAMATKLGVSRNTVSIAYQTLVAEGYLAARERSGHFISAEAMDGAPASPEIVAHGDGGEVDWRRRAVKDLSRQRFIERPPDWGGYEYPFVYGQVDHTIFPIAEWRDSVRQAMGRRWLDEWTMDRYAADDSQLIEEIARRILPRRGISAGRDQILVTLGAQNALYLIAALLVDRGTRCLIEDPGYPDLRNMLTLRTDRLDFAPVDAEGMAAGARLAATDIVFATPSHHYPSTVTMSLERRKALLAAASAHDLIVVEDDYEFETNYLGAPLPALKSLDAGGRVIYLGSLSKSMMPGLRLGFIVADRALIGELRALRRLMLRHPPGANQRAAAIFMANGHYDSLVRRIHRVYRERWRALAGALAEHLPGWARSPGFGGSSFWLTGPEGLDSEAVAARALVSGVVIEPGLPFFADAEAGRRHFRLGFSLIPAERIGRGVALLRRAIDAR